jgi:hypothetical protein
MQSDKYKGRVRSLKVLSVGVALLVAYGSREIPAATTAAQGQQWLTWSEETQLQYTSGFLSGFAIGFREGCQSGEKLYSPRLPAGLPAEKCILTTPAYSEFLEHYVQEVTSYYKSFPSDRNVPINRVLEAISDSRHLSQQKMHEYFSGTVPVWSGDTK